MLSCFRVILVEYEDSKVVYELFCVYCKKYSERIPITFLLGFYVTQVSNSRITNYDNLYTVSGCNLQFSITMTRKRNKATRCFVFRTWTQHGTHWLLLLEPEHFFYIFFLLKILKNLLGCIPLVETVHVLTMAGHPCKIHSRVHARNRCKIQVKF